MGDFSICFSEHLTGHPNNLPKSVAKFADLRFTFSCQNLFTITSYKGMDPAGISFMSSGVDVNDGIDFGAYPLTRTYTLGVRMNF